MRDYWSVSESHNRAVASAMATDPRLVPHRIAAELVDGLSVLFGEPHLVGRG